jgi:hypothetical protein
VLIHAPTFDLDLIHWKDGGLGAKQDEDAARQKVADLAATERWVIEGVYGWLAEVAVPRAMALIWRPAPSFEAPQRSISDRARSWYLVHGRRSPSPTAPRFPSGKALPPTTGLFLCLVRPASASP